MPQSSAFAARLNFRLGELAGRFGTPVHIYDEVGILQTQQELNRAFKGEGSGNFSL